MSIVDVVRNGDDRLRVCTCLQEVAGGKEGTSKTHFAQCEGADGAPMMRGRKFLTYIYGDLVV